MQRIPSATHPRPTLLAAVLAATVLAGAVAIQSAGAGADTRASTRRPDTSDISPASDVFLCTATITYKKGSSIQAYEQSFSLAPGETFEEDFSQALNERTFTATATQAQDGVLISFEYFNDVSALATVEVDASFTMRPGEHSDDFSGHHDYYNSNSGSYDVYYTFTCERL